MTPPSPPPRGVPHACFPGLSEAQPPLSNFILLRLKGDVASSTLAEGGSGAAATAWGAQEGRDLGGGRPPSAGKIRGCLCCLLQAQLWSSVRAGQRAYTVAKHCFVLPWRREETARRRWPIPSRCPWCGLPSNLLESRSFPFSCSFHFLLMFDFNLVFPLLELDTIAFFKETSRKKIFSHDRNKIIAQKSNTLLSVKRKI